MLSDDLKWIQRIAGRVAKRLPPSVDREELVSDGYLALLKLRKRFDAGRGVPFRGFAHQRIVGAMIDGLRARRGVTPVLRVEPQTASTVSEPIGDLLHRLARRHRLVLQLHYLEGLPLKSIAECFAVSKVRVTYLHRQALEAADPERSSASNGKPQKAPPR